ncbi:MAG: Crp/Fnr family transcriptional regulator [Ferruginibacter sp.]|nr:Crp/Fnr family transcriptional regulator [Ferruginibacter sp.]
MEKLFTLLNSINRLSYSLTEHLEAILKTKQLGKKDYLLKAGHICHQICFIETGFVRCFYLSGDSEVCSWFMKEGDVIISIESFFQQKESYESIQALEDCTIYYIEYAELNAIYQNFPEFNFTGRVLTERYYQLWAQQLYALRMKQAPERYNWLIENHRELILRVPAKYLASYLGITEVMLSIIKGRK